jgi:carboxymethylenebutenolidase
VEGSLRAFQPSLSVLPVTQALRCDVIAATSAAREGDAMGQGAADVTIEVPGIGTIPAYYSPAAELDPDGRAPGVVVVHEIFGLTNDIRRIADEFAARGYHSIAPDLMSHGGKVRCMVSAFRALQKEQGRPFAEIAAARSWLTSRDDVNGRVGIAGFCLGGAFAILMASRGFDASAAQYGMLPRNLEAALSGSCPMVASYGGRDGTLKGAAPRLEAALTDLGVEHDVKEYADAGHSFMNHSSVPGWMKPFSSSMHAGYVDTAASDAWERIDRMFSSALRD